MIRTLAFVLGVVTLGGTAELQAQELPDQAGAHSWCRRRRAAASMRSRASWRRALSERWPQRVIVDNRPGGAGNIGAREVAKAEPDGYTLLVWNDTLLINPDAVQGGAVRSQARFRAGVAVDVFAERARRASDPQASRPSPNS